MRRDKLSGIEIARNTTSAAAVAKNEMFCSDSQTSG